MRLRIPVSLSGRAVSGTAAAACRQSSGACARAGVMNASTMQAANPMTPTDSLRLCMVQSPRAPTADSHSLTWRARELQRLFQHLVAAFGDALDGAAHRMGRTDADAVMARAVVPEHAHAGPRQDIAARHHERIDIAVGACGGLADDIGQVIGLDGSQHSLGLADGAAAGHEGDVPFNPMLERHRLPSSAAVVFGNALAVGSDDDRDLPDRRLQGTVTQMVKEVIRLVGIAAHVEDDGFGLCQLRQGGVEIVLGRAINIEIEDAGLEFRPRGWKYLLELLGLCRAVEHDLALASVGTLDLELHGRTARTKLEVIRQNGVALPLRCGGRGECMQA